MKIVMFTDAYWPRVNGVTVSVDSFSRALIKEGHQVLIICSSYPESYDAPVSLVQGEAREDDPKIVRVPSMPALITKEDRIAKFHKWYWVFKQVELFNPQIIHINTEFMIAEFGFQYARAHNVPAIYTFHTMWEDYSPNYFPMFPPFLVRFVTRGILKNILTRSYKVIVPTPQIEEVVHKYKPKTETFLLPTGIEPELFHHEKAEIEVFREKLEDRYPALKGKRILLFAGRVVREKNISFLLKIIPDIAAKFPDVILLIVGNGPDLDYFREEAVSTGVEKLCVFTDYMERQDLALVYAVSEIFVFPSLTDTQGLVTLEAMLSDKPVVAIGALGTLMVMGGDNGGFMVKNDPAEFTARVLDLLGDPELYKRKAVEAKAHAKSWSINEIAKKLVGIYQTVIDTYKAEYGESRTPMWEMLMDKRWWKVNNKIFRKKTNRKWREFFMNLANRGPFAD
ncbi:glycosyltransferase [Leadbettera azotonutricia]|uniref:Glycosyltransferase n=1 Tax=Leadbettera azotonutricia (strain ATCC BAA-888 / DSM 13862 / ZAS-9) TaxID=545695 RepID=F5Y6V6_LEAAZ|nr:glycosyltransferase [Leadbettera azotonutricia]AEF82208.1 glycosyltransferase [Leadbettera azotonutricia ZAS-9]